jgi:hypothetical protein
VFSRLRALLTGRPPLLEGGLYATRKEDGVAIAKVLRVDRKGAHLRLYAQRFAQIPAGVDEASLRVEPFVKGAPLSIGHVPVSHASLAGWGLQFVQQSSVSPGELEGFRMWEEGRGGYF